MSLSRPTCLSVSRSISKKMKLAPVIGALAVSGVAQAGELYSDENGKLSYFGLINLGVQSRALSSQDSELQVDSNMMTTSYFGLKGEAKITDSLTAKAEVASFIQFDKGESTRGINNEGLYSRFAWGGLEGDFGTVKAGRVTSLNFINTVVFNPFFNSSAYSPSFMHSYVGSPAQPMATGSGATDSSWNNAINYTLPKLGKVSIGVMAAPDEGGTTGERVGASVSMMGFPFAIMATAEKISGATLTYPLGFTSIAGSTPPFTAQDFSVYQLGSWYDFKSVKLYGQVSKTEVEGTRLSTDQDYSLNTVQLGASAPVGNGAFKASFASTTMERSWAKDLERETLTLGYDHNLSKQAVWFTRLMQDKVTDQKSGISYGTGVSYKF
ncbi:porin [Marinomonas mediterranea]|nr:porin [Marinomonas mediterranea]WCN15401.1 porin [Marinomonas mediterranea]WCN19458.1 porin [Marinomonas mediterranea MMB-1]